MNRWYSKTASQSSRITYRKKCHRRGKSPSRTMPARTVLLPLPRGWRTQLPNVAYRRLEVKGRGFALRDAWSASSATVLAYLDVDLSTDLAALPPLVAPLLSGHSESKGATKAVGLKGPRPDRPGRLPTTHSRHPAGRSRVLSRQACDRQRWAIPRPASWQWQHLLMLAIVICHVNGISCDKYVASFVMLFSSTNCSLKTVQRFRAPSGPSCHAWKPKRLRDWLASVFRK